MEKQRVVALPLDRIWDETGETITSVRGRYLLLTDIKELLRVEPVAFVVADLGSPLERIPVDQRFEFWKKEVQAHLVNDYKTGFRLEDFPDEYAYLASEWPGQTSAVTVLLERYH